MRMTTAHYHGRPALKPSMLCYHVAAGVSWTYRLDVVWDALIVNIIKYIQQTAPPYRRRLLATMGFHKRACRHQQATPELKGGKFGRRLMA